MNQINELLHSIYSGLSLADHAGDVADYLPELVRLQQLIARIPQEPELLDEFDPDGIASVYKDEGYVWCHCNEEWKLAEDCCDCACAVEDPEPDED